MDEKNNLVKKRSGFLYILIPALLIFIGLLGWQFYKYKLANKNITKLVDEKSNGLYSIHYDSLFIDELSGILHVKNIKIIPDTDVYNQLVKGKKNPSVLLRLSIPSLDIIRLQTPKALLSKQIDGNKIEISNADIELDLNNFLKDSSTYNPAKDITKELLGKFLHIKIDSVRINNSNLLVKNIPSGNEVCKIVNASFLLTDLLIDSVSKNDTSRILFSKNINVDCDKIVLSSKIKDYHFDIEKIKFASSNNTLHIGSFKIIPRLPEAKFESVWPVQRDRYDFVMDDIVLENINRQSMMQKIIEADNLIINKSSFKIYRDLSYPRDTLSRLGKYPQQMLVKIPVQFLLRKITFVKSFIEYKEKNPKSDSAGKVQFYDVQATMNNVTNISKEIKKNNESVLVFNSKFLNKAAIHAKLIMFLNNPKGKFSIAGNIGAMDATALNPLTKPMGLAKIESGKINSVDFNFMGNDSATDGKLTILYDDMKVSLLKKNDEENKYTKKFLPSLFASALIKKSNPEKNQPPRVADVHFKRNMNKSFFNLLWKSIFTGIKESAGMKL